MVNELTFKCSDGGQHGDTQLARITWTTIALKHEITGGEEVWDAKSDPTTLEVDSLVIDTRRTKNGATARTERVPVKTTTRADGGRTFQLPRCPRCHRVPSPVRDDTLHKLESLPLPTLDIAFLSQMGRIG